MVKDGIRKDIDVWSWWSVWSEVSIDLLQCVKFIGSFIERVNRKSARSHSTESGPYVFA